MRPEANIIKLPNISRLDPPQLKAAIKELQSKGFTDVPDYPGQRCDASRQGNPAARYGKVLGSAPSIRCCARAKFRPAAPPAP